MIDLRDIVFWTIAAALLLASARSSPLAMPADVWHSISPVLACSNLLPPDCLEPLPGL
jgi:hypothetical protein